MWQAGRGGSEAGQGGSCRSKSSGRAPESCGAAASRLRDVPQAGRDSQCGAAACGGTPVARGLRAHRETPRVQTAGLCAVCAVAGRERQVHRGSEG